MNAQLKRFIGWRALGPNEKIQTGDVFVLIGQHMSPGRALTPEVGESVGRYIGHPASEWESATIYWYPYRRTDAKPIQRRLMMSRIFSQPLPLP